MLPKLTQIKADDRREELLRQARDDAVASAARHPGSAARFARRPTAVARGIAVGCALMLLTVAVAKAAAPRIVVGPHGKVAGHGYGEWLRNCWQPALSSPLGASACQRMRVGSTTVVIRRPRPLSTRSRHPM